MKITGLELFYNRTVSAFLTGIFVLCSDSYSNFYSFFIAFAMCHFVLAFYYSLPQFKEVCKKTQSLVLALAISSLGLLVTLLVFPRISFIFIVHEVLSEIFIPLTFISFSVFQDVVKDRWVLIFRFISCCAGLSFIARHSGYLAIVSEKQWLIAYAVMLAALCLRLLFFIKKESSFKSWLNIFSFELIVFVAVILSAISGVTLTTAHIAFYHGFFWFFFIFNNFVKNKDPRLPQFLKLHLVSLVFFWIFTPKALSLLGLVKIEDFAYMDKLYVNMTLLTASVHIFSSFYLSKHNPKFIRSFFYKN